MTEYREARLQNKTMIMGSDWSMRIDFTTFSDVLSSVEDSSALNSVSSSPTSSSQRTRFDLDSEVLELSSSSEAGVDSTGRFFLFLESPRL